jgi:hypothetical protein
MKHIKASQLLILVQNLIIQHKIRCAESVYQVDSINEELPEMMIKICDLVGYYEDLVDAQAEIKMDEQESNCQYCMKDYCVCNLHGMDV